LHKPNILASGLTYRTLTYVTVEFISIVIKALLAHHNMTTTDINHGGLRIKTKFTLLGIIILIIGWRFLLTLFIVGTSVDIVLGLNLFGRNGAFLLNRNIFFFRLILIKVIGLQKILQLLEGIDLNKKLDTQELPAVHFARVIIFSFIM
jgi:hypothetical protein